MNNVYGEPMPENIYHTNDTMRLLGHQFYMKVITPEARNMMDDIMRASTRIYRTRYDISMDMVVLGYILGKRAERARRAKQAGAPRTIDLQEEYREETKRLLEQLHDLILLRRIYTIVLRAVERRKKS